MKNVEAYYSIQDMLWPTDSVAVPCMHNANFPCDCPLKRYSGQKIKEIVSQMHHGESHGISREFENQALNPRFFGTIAHLLVHPNWPCPSFVYGQYGTFSKVILAFREQIVLANKNWFKRSKRKAECFVWPE